MIERIYDLLKEHFDKNKVTYSIVYSIIVLAIVLWFASVLIRIIF